MNCKKAAQLIPLFVEADLEAAERQRVTEHLESCDSCGKTVKEFQASQSLLRSVALPEFDETVFSPVRSSVLNEIACPQISNVSNPFWHWKTAFAASLATIILTSGAVNYWPDATENIVAQIPGNSDKKHEFSAVASSKDLVKPSSVSSKVLKPRRGCKNIARGEVSASERNPGKIGTNHSSPERATAFHTQIIPESVAPSETTDPKADLITTAIPKPENTEPEMLRIELQTADPNIRIIWFAPKETIAANTKADLR